ncbi:hypothetical protein CLU79DRAFT_703392, partial [Phycomyces nitens]
RISPGKEDDVARQRLLQLMIKRLQSKFLCRKIYASPNCLSSMPIMEINKDRQEHILSKLHSCNGDIQDLIEFLYTCGLSVRIIVIDYVGHSTNSNDVKLFVK